jgi:hypothetical protein
MKLSIFLFLIFFPTYSFSACGPFATASFNTYVQPGITIEIADAVLFPASAYAFDMPFIVDEQGLSALNQLKTYFVCRFQEYQAQLMSTPLFNVINTLKVSSISGTSSMPLNFGSYGLHDFDFSSFLPDTGFLIIRSVLLCLVTFYSIVIFTKDSQ